ncbi:MAG: nucleotidyltransferase domain-containing protein [Planctomycetota bacterium]
MPENQNDFKKLLSMLKKHLKKVYGKRLGKMILYGSWARGEQNENSDIDILMVLDDFKSVYEEISRVSPIVSDISQKYDTLIGLVPCRQNDFENESELLYKNVKREGVLQ